MHTHHKGTGKVHSFRGLLKDGKQKKISIQGSVGSIAWRITKFEGLPNIPFTSGQEDVLKVYREKQSSVDGAINFDDNQLLAALAHAGSVAATGVSSTVIFDNSLFSRNIYVTHKDVGAGGRDYNYYIELEEVTVSATGMAQLALAATRRTKKY